MLTYDVPGGAAWSLRVRRGRKIQITAMGDGATACMLLFDAADPVDRMNVPDTLKAQMSAHVRAPMVLMSDRGAALASVTASSLDWHDALSGHSTDAHLERFGPSSYHADRNERRVSARAGLVSELRKHGRGPADLHGTVNWFSKVQTADDGTLTYVPGHCAEGDQVELRAELDLLLILSTAPHPLDPVWRPSAVRVAVTEGSSYADDDPSVTFRAESARALAQSKAVFA